MGPQQQSTEIHGKLSALLDLAGRVYGTEEMVLKAGKLEALLLIRSQEPAQQLLGLQRLIFENPTLKEAPAENEYGGAIVELEEALADLLARRTLEESLEYKIKERLEEQHEQYLQEIKKEVLQEWIGVENPQTLKKYARAEKMFARNLPRSAQEMLRPARLDQVIGQNEAVAALVSKLASPYPPHIILYGPPGVGKTTAARLALQRARKIEGAIFSEDSPFVEVDGATLRWDPR
ncbi:MAG: AAA family ATPase, partial [Firmicutes bacterium]|nr:AAA family ATPase [Bacillota bacterium]